MSPCAGWRSDGGSTQICRYHAVKNTLKATKMCWQSVQSDTVMMSESDPQHSDTYYPEPEHPEELDLRVSPSSTLTPAEETLSRRHDEGCSSSSARPLWDSSSASLFIFLRRSHDCHHPARSPTARLTVSPPLSLYWSGWRTSCLTNDVTWGERSLIITSSCLWTTNTVWESQTGTQNHFYYVYFILLYFIKTRSHQHSKR